jgi:HEAT repeat protein
MKRLLPGVLCLTFYLAATVDGAPIEELITQLRDKDPDLRRAAAKQLADAGPDAKPATAALIKALKDDDLFVRRFAAEALGAIEADPKAAVPPLSALLASEKERKEVQEAAAGSLGKLGKTATAPLIEAAKDHSKDALVRKRAVDGLGHIGPDARAALPDLTDLLTGKTKNGKKNTNPDAGTNDIRLEVAAALGSIATSKDEDVIKALETFSTDKANKKNKELNKVINKAIKDIKARGN